MAQTSARSMGATMSAFKPGVTMPAGSMAAARLSRDALPTGSIGSPKGAAKGGAAAAMGSTVGAMGGDMTNTMASTASRTSRTKFLKWFNSLTPRQGPGEEQELPHLERSRSPSSHPLPPNSLPLQIYVALSQKATLAVLDSKIVTASWLKRQLGSVTYGAQLCIVPHMSCIHT